VQPPHPPRARPAPGPRRRPRPPRAARPPRRRAPDRDADRDPRYLYRVAARQQLCNPGSRSAHRGARQDAEGEGLPGVEVRVTWPGGETLHRPQAAIDPGYADYDPQPDTAYTVDLPGSPSAAGSPPVADLAPFTCGGGVTQGVWRVVFERLEP
jgi:hypothetical protein